MYVYVYTSHTKGDTRSKFPKRVCRFICSCACICIYTLDVHARKLMQPEAQTHIHTHKFFHLLSLPLIHKRMHTSTHATTRKHGMLSADHKNICDAVPKKKSKKIKQFPHLQFHCGIAHEVILPALCRVRKHCVGSRHLAELLLKLLKSSTHTVACPVSGLESF